MTKPTPTPLPRLRRPVRREGAERYLLVTLVAFAVTVIGTRWFLELTGFPQIGGGDLHIAHALWGGVALFAAALGPILLAGRIVYLASATLAGIGIGLFIDEVGKLITSTNDYFYPAAAPIIYATFLLAVLVWIRVRRRDRPDPRTQLLTALELLEESVEGDLQDAERDLLQERLAAAAAGRADCRSSGGSPATCWRSWRTARSPSRRTGSTAWRRSAIACGNGPITGSADVDCASSSSRPSSSRASGRCSPCSTSAHG